MIAKTILHGLLAAGVIAGAGFVWTKVSYAGFTADGPGYTAPSGTNGTGGVIGGVMWLVSDDDAPGDDENEDDDDVRDRGDRDDEGDRDDD